MGLKEAIRAVLPWAGKDRLAGVLVVPSDGDKPGYAETQNEDGLGARRYYVDPEHQIHAWLGAASIKSALSAVKASESWSLTPRSETSYVLTDHLQGTHYVQAPPFPDSYASPLFPQHLRLFDAPEHITALLATCPKPTREYAEMPALSGVLFAPGYVMSTNQNALTRIRRSDLAPTQRLVPRALFEKWPSKATRIRPAIGWTDSHCFVQIDHTLRWAPLMSAQFPDRASHLPTAHQGHKTRLHRAQLQNVLKDSVSAGKPMLNLRFAENQLSVSALDETEDVAYRSLPLTAPTAHKGLVSVFCNGRLLHEMVKACPTDMLTLQYSDLKTDPLNVWSDDGCVQSSLKQISFSGNA